MDRATHLEDGDSGRGLDTDPAWVKAVREELLAWGASRPRDFPWLNERDPFRVLVAETMLVQTTTTAVAPYYARFLELFPTVQALAGAGDEELLRAWEGLGYYRRARNLLEAARRIVRDHGGRVPDDSDALQGLPGIGPYIAGAVLSFAYNQQAPILEANSQRVLARLLAWEQPLGISASTRRLWQASQRLVPNDFPGSFNQALMDLGATTCATSNPRCGACPLALVCETQRLSRQESIPKRRERPKPTPVRELAAIVTQNDRYLVVQRPQGQLWEGFWEFPTVHLTGPNPANRPHADSPEPALVQLTGLELDLYETVKTISYSVTRYRVTLCAHRGLVKKTDAGGRPASGLAKAHWVTEEEMADLPFPSPQRKLASPPTLSKCRR